MDLPPIPEQRSILPEVSPQPVDKFILAGTAIGVNKNAIVKKITSVQEKNQEENIIVSVGDYVQGRQIVDITSNSLIFDDGKNPMYISGFEDLAANLSVDEKNLSDIVEENKILNDTQDYEEELSGEENLIPNENFVLENEIVDTVNTKIIENVSVESEYNQEKILSSDESVSVNSIISDSATTSADNTYNEISPLDITSTTNKSKNYSNFAK